MTAKEIKKEIREHKATMKASGIKITSCFNGGLCRETYAANARLFSLKTDLLNIAKVEEILE